MKYKTKCLACYLSFVLMIACGQKEVADAPSIEKNRTVSDSYKAPHFEQDDRKQEAQILAENFYMDNTRELYVKQMKELMEKAGPIKSVGDLDPYNQLRGTFEIQAENGTVEVFFTLSPEKDPLIQMLDLSMH